MKRVFMICADYRPQNEKSPRYYLTAQTKKEARQKFSELGSWLKIYEVKEVEPELAGELLKNPERLLFMGG